MVRIQQYIHWLKHALLVVVALFSLASCSVKEPVFRAIGADYQRPLNKTRTTPNFENHCKTSPDRYQINSNFYNSDHKVLRTSNEWAEFVWQQAIDTEKSLPESEIVSENIRLYILFKRLKFDMA
ncbi:hypothetical protein [Draconibacterium halophilum]|uniref:Uncharacterized protein n=1 Tax=Draconibacterium halophilum TaxID=2706887 RepID=A0A6C0RAG1_9BACT|nr:hypothetical protein [Draconibacterium halophilum]QIA07079.1 hypothetical protein G0Q07_04750 [Draconibacterium halophilum]